MKKYNVLAAILLSMAFSCEKSNETYFSFDESKFKSEYHNDDVLALEVLNAKNKTIDSVVYYANDVKIASVKGGQKTDFPLKTQKLGYQNLKAIVYFDGETSGQEITGRVEIVSAVEPKLLTYKIVNTYTHDITSFTEGLEFYRDTLFEGTGQYGKSRLLKVDYKTGKILKSLDLQREFFGEGITIINNKIYQLTYKEKTGFIYNADTWKLEKKFTYDKDFEGWGMTNDGKFIYQTDGTEKIWKMDPETQKMTDYINVYSSSNKIKSLNELELINGKLYGNIWQKDAIAVINPETGAVEGVLNLVGLRKDLKNPEAEVLNGIAYNPKTRTIFVTGKNWDKLFEITVSE